MSSYYDTATEKGKEMNKRMKRDFRTAGRKTKMKLTKRQRKAFVYSRAAERKVKQ